MKFITSMTVIDKILGSAPFVFEGDYAAGVREAARLGFDGVEIHIADPDDLNVAPIDEALAQTGLRLTAIGTGRAYVNDGLSITDPDDGIRQAAVTRLEKFIALGQHFGATVIIGCMRGNVASPDQLPRTMEYLRQTTAYLDGVARAAGVTLAFEPINRYENNFLCTMGEISDFIRKNHLTNFGILADTFHMNIEEPDLLESIRAYAPELRYVHVADSNRLYPGGGHIDFPALLKELNRVGYEGVLSAECLPLPSKEEARTRWITEVRRMMDQA